VASPRLTPPGSKDSKGNWALMGARGVFYRQATRPPMRRIRLVAYGASLESWLGASPHGFESHILRRQSAPENLGHLFILGCYIFFKAGGRNVVAKHWRVGTVFITKELTETNSEFLAVVLARIGWCGRPDFYGCERTIMAHLFGSRFNHYSFALDYFRSRQKEVLTNFQMAWTSCPVGVERWRRNGLQNPASASILRSKRVLRFTHSPQK